MRDLTPSSATFSSRRRLFAVTAVALATLLIPLIAIGATQDWWFARIPQWPKPEGTIVVVRDGSWNGVPWTLAAYRSEGNVCFGLTPNWQANEGGAGGGMACGIPLRGVAQQSQAYPELHWVGYLLSAGGESFPGWIAGPAAPEVVEVGVVLRSGSTITTPTFAAPDELGLKINFYVAQFPCGDDVRTLIPKDAAGNALENWVRPVFPQAPPPAACGIGS